MDKYYLLLDSSNAELTIGIIKNDKLVYSYEQYAWQRQSEYMIPEIKKALDSVNISLSQIDVIALGIGPGSYTGLRIPMTIAKTVACINNIDIIALSSLKILGTPKEKYIAIMDAKSHRSYVGIYNNGQSVIEDSIIDNESLDDLISEYLKQGYTIKGDIAYLPKYKNEKTNVIEGLMEYALISTPIKNIDKLEPIYLKELYDYKKSN